MNEQLRQEMLARLNDIGQKCIAETNASAGDIFQNIYHKFLLKCNHFL